MEELQRQLEDGRVYDRDLPALADAVNGVLEVLGDRWVIVSSQYRRRR